MIFQFLIPPNELMRNLLIIIFKSNINEYVLEDSFISECNNRHIFQHVIPFLHDEQIFNNIKIQKQMGGFFSKMFSKLVGKKQLKIIIIGLDNSGKTTILNKLHLNEVKQTVPTIGFNMEVVNYKNLQFQVWDLGGQNSIRQYWEMYYPNTNAILYVVDSSDRKRFSKASEELSKVLDKQILKNVPLLVMANKKDLPESSSEKDISDVLGLAKIKERDWAIYNCSGKSGTGLNEAMDWVVEKLAPLL